MSIKTWWKQHFTLGIVLSGAAGSLLCSIFLEVIWPNSIPFLRSISRVVGNALAAVWTWLTAGVSVPRWWHLLLLLYAVATLLLAAAVWIKTKLVPSWREYTSDTFMGIRWRWRYNTYDNDIENLCPYCLHCDRELVLGPGLINSNDFSMTTHNLKCPLCGPQKGFQGEISSVMAQIEAEIRLKVRTGSWMEVVKRYPSRSG